MSIEPVFGPIAAARASDDLALRQREAAAARRASGATEVSAADGRSLEVGDGGAGRRETWKHPVKPTRAEPEPPNVPPPMTEGDHIDLVG